MFGDLVQGLGRNESFILLDILQYGNQVTLIPGCIFPDYGANGTRHVCDVCN